MLSIGCSSSNSYRIFFLLQFNDIYINEIGEKVKQLNRQSTQPNRKTIQPNSQHRNNKKIEYKHWIKQIVKIIHDTRSTNASEQAK